MNRSLPMKASKSFALTQLAIIANHIEQISLDVLIARIIPSRPVPSSAKHQRENTTF